MLNYEPMRFLVLLLINLCTLKILAGEPIQDLLEIQSREAEVLSGAEDIPSDKIDKVEFWVQFNKQPEGFKLLLYNTWRTLLAQKRIKRLTQDIRKKLNIPRLHCVGEQRCSELVAVYLILSNYILVDYEELNYNTATWFFHELVHAVQYTHRFPMDIDYLYRLSLKQNSEMRVKPEQVFDYLRFFYENQANWYTMRLGQNEAWNAAGQNAILSGLETAMKITVGLISFTVLPRVMRHYFEKLLPSIDHSYGTSVENVLWETHEPIVMKDYHSLNPGIHIDLGAFTKLTRAVERGYFGDLDFLYQNDNGDQKIYRDLNNRFYESSLSIGRCANSLAEFNDLSPFLNWFTVSLEKIYCGSYIGLDFWISRDEILQLFKRDLNGKTYQKGTRGGRGPGLDILPAAQPQLLIWPE